MNQSRWTSLASFAAIMAAGITSLGACAGNTDTSSTDTTKTALSSTDTASADSDASTTATDTDAGKECGEKGKKD